MPLKRIKKSYDWVFTYRNSALSGDLISLNIRTVDTASDWLIANLGAVKVENKYRSC